MNAIKIYRIANRLHNLKLRVIPKVLKSLMFLLYNSHIPYECKIGNNTTFGYGGIGVVIHKKAVIGNNVMISPQVTIGGRSNNPRLPVIGDNVYIGTGAKILGDIVIKDNVIIGANSVVLKSVDSNSIVAGNPAKVIKSGVDIFKYCNLKKIK